MKATLSFILLFSVTALRIPADPSFIVSTFSTGNESWQPDNWTTNNIDGLSPGNPYLEIAADGSGKTGKMITFNVAPAWTGNYYGSGVTGLQLDIRNMSDSDDVYLRVVLGNRVSPQESGGTWWISQTAAFIPLESDWNSVFLPISESDMQIVGNIMGQSDNDSFAATMGDIRNIRILSAAIPVGATGDEFLGTVGIDNVALVPEPETFSMMALGTITLILRRCRGGKQRLRKRMHATWPKHF